MEVKILSSLEKCFADQSISDKTCLLRASAFKNEKYSFQLAINSEMYVRRTLHLVVDSEYADKISVRRVRHVPVIAPAVDTRDANYIRTEPGLYPDILEPFDTNCFFYVNGITESFWFTAEGLPAGEHKITVNITNANKDVVLGSATLTLEVIDALLPEQKLVATNWFHCDCLATYYDVEVFSERHWEIIENFVKSYAENGLNLILTPVLTPELDTEIGKERPTVQLVDIKVTGGVYRYNFKKLDRWIEMCDRCGIKYFEMAHLFSQWGAKFCPKVMATVDGEYKRIFGWETSSTSPEYKKFLRSFLNALVKHLKALGVDKRCYWHISDEPHGEEALKQYKACRNIVKNILKDYIIMDALSDFEFYKSGVLSTPIPANDAIEPFIKANVTDLWVYYCCSQTVGVSNQFIAMPSARNRVIAAQLYKYNIYGFLQWGYNFYYSQLSRYPINPYVVNDCDSAFSAGDPFKVYPAPNGKPLDSIRYAVFAEAMQDLRAMQLLESLTSREAVMAIIEESSEITFSKFPHCPCYVLSVREKVNEAIKKALKK